MPVRTGGSCRAVAPLLARYDDPDLEEAERVLLSTHLLRCPACLARAQQYRAHERRLRQLPPIVLDSRVRAAIYGRIAATTGRGAGARELYAARPLWPGAAFLSVVAAVVLLGGMAATQLSAGAGGALATRSATNEIFSRQFAGALLIANPTRAIGGGDTPGAYTLAVAARPTATQPAALAATIRAIYPTDGRLVVAFDGAAQDQRLVITRDTLILRPDGRLLSLAGLSAGAAISVRYEQGATGNLIAREIIVQR